MTRYNYCTPTVSLINGLTVGATGVNTLDGWDDLRPDEACLKGNLTINGVFFHAWAVQVREDEDGNQEAVLDPYDRLEDVYALLGDCPQTVRIAGYEGDWVLAIFPHAH